MTPARIRALGELFDRQRLLHGRDVAIETIADELTGRRRTAPDDYADPQAVSLILAVCQAAGGEGRGWQLFNAVRGPSTTPRLVAVRDEACWVLGQRGYTDGEIGAAIGRERSSVTSARARHAARMAASEVLRARMARFLGEGRVAS